MAAIPAIGGILQEFGCTWAIVVAAVSVYLIFRNLMSFSLWCVHKPKISMVYAAIVSIVFMLWFLWGQSLTSTRAKLLIAKSWWAKELHTGLSNFF